MAQYLTGYDHDELAILLGDKQRPSPTRAKALLRWLHQGPGCELPGELPAQLPGISKRIWLPIYQDLTMPKFTQVDEQTSKDGTVKILSHANGSPIETVMIPTDKRTTVCVSSQSGCARGCGFCATAKMGIIRNLTAGEIVAQVLMANQFAPKNNPVRNVVFMGMGEPMDNLDEVLRAIRILTCSGGLGLSPRHITVSSVGVLPKMQAFLDQSGARLALSLNATTDAQRDHAMPVNHRWPLEQVVAFIAANASARSPIFVEYILMAGFNDSEEDLKRLVGLMTGLNVRLNLIPLNPHRGSAYLKPEVHTVMAFHKGLMAAGIPAFVRMTRGDEIKAACGQLQRKGEGRGKYREAQSL